MGAYQNKGVQTGTCKATTPAGNGRRWSCSEPAGHKTTKHKARDLSGTVVHSWSSNKTPRGAR